jgi:CDP-glycerol glycerophosphotransferase
VPRVSVVLPIYNVERYARACLESVAAQTVRDLEVIVVDDGSTDGSAAIAERFADRDARFRLIRQPNSGLGSARNTGTDAAGGDFLAFVDGDDVLPPRAYERMLDALDETGSDFATGNVQRLRRVGKESRYLAQTFEVTRLKTHITRFRPLLADRIAPNKLWRRSFWDAHALRFPEGVVHEDIPVVVPAHFMAGSVDVIASPVYYYRIRDTGELSITQRRLEPKVLLDRLAAVEHVRDFLAREGPRGARRWYEASLVADDLRYFLDVLEGADDAYRRLFLDRVNAFLDTASRRIYRPLPAIQRLKWHLVRERRIPELLEVLRFQREDLPATPAVRIRGRWYGDYPFLRDRSARIPRSVYRLGPELTLSCRVESLRFEDGRLRVEGWAYISGVGAPAPGSQRVSLVAVRLGRLRRLRRTVAGARLKTSATSRPDITAAGKRPFDVTWSGFSATLDPHRLRAGGGDAEWRVFLTVRAGLVRRGTTQLWGRRTQPPRAVELGAADDVRLIATPVSRRRIALLARPRWAVVRGHRLLDDVLELTGEIGGEGRTQLTARVTRGRRWPTLEYPIDVDGDAFALRVPLADLLAHDDPDADPEPPRWMVDVVGAARRHRLMLADAAPDGLWAIAGRQLTLFRTVYGDLALRLRTPRPLLTDARWTPDGTLELTGERRGLEGGHELLLVARDRFERHYLDPIADGAGERFTIRVRPAHMPSLAGERPLGEGPWELQTRPAGAGRAALVSVVVERELMGRLPVRAVFEHKAFAFATTTFASAVLVAERDLDEDERGPFHQRRLQHTAYAARRSEPLREAIVYESFGGRECSDSPRAIHAELMRRGAPLEHLWVVDDGRFRPPPGATGLRAGSREYHAALARARYVVTNGELPRWFAPRPDQVCVQTGRGVPLRRATGNGPAQPTAWRYVLSPNRFATPILREAFPGAGELLETGLPRTDVLAAPDRERRGRELRRRLGIPDGVRSVLYAPSGRDHVRDRDDRPRLDVQLDIRALRQALAGEAVILFRAPHSVVDTAPATRDGFVRDVTSFPDCTELLLAADVLVTDYSSVMCDFANTGRPMVFFAYDLDEVGGFHLDLPAVLPGPMVRTTAELAAALSDLDAARAEYARRYEEFAARFCELDDGGATARVVDRVF